MSQHQSLLVGSETYPLKKFKVNVVKMKYLVIERGNVEVPLVFPSSLLHHKTAGKSKVKSAGYCKPDAAGKWPTGWQVGNTKYECAVAERRDIERALARS